MKELDEAIHQILKGGSLIFTGTVLGMLLALLNRMILARTLTPAQYGTLNLTLIVINIALLLALLGIPNGLPRGVSKYMYKNTKELPTLIYSSIAISGVTLIVWTVALGTSSPVIAHILKNKNLEITLRVTSLEILAIGLLHVLVAVSRGLGRVRENIYYLNILPQSIFLVLVIIWMYTWRHFIGIFYAHVITYTIVLSISIVDSKRKGILPPNINLDPKMAIELVKFSIPLMLMSIMDYLLGWTDSLMLSYYTNSEVVGIYNVASPMSKMLTLPMNSVAFVYMPLAVKFFTSKDHQNLVKLYQTTARLITSASFLVFIIVFSFPKIVISLLFSSKYLDAVEALRILSLGHLLYISLGLTATTLIVIGYPKVNFYSNTAGLITNIVLNSILIPKHGIIGAAVSTSLSLVITGLYRTIYLWKRHSIHPFEREYIVMMIIIFMFIIIGFLIQNTGLISSIFLSVLCLSAVLYVSLRTR